MGPAKRDLSQNPQKTANPNLLAVSLSLPNEANRYGIEHDRSKHS